MKSMFWRNVIFVCVLGGISYYWINWLMFRFAMDYMALPKPAQILSQPFYPLIIGPALLGFIGFVLLAGGSWVAKRWIDCARLWSGMMLFFACLMVVPSLCLHGFGVGIIGKMFNNFTGVFLVYKVLLVGAVLGSLVFLGAAAWQAKRHHDVSHLQGPYALTYTLFTMLLAMNVVSVVLAVWSMNSRSLEATILCPFFLVQLLWALVVLLPFCLYVMDAVARYRGLMVFYLVSVGSGLLGFILPFVLFTPSGLENTMMFVRLVILIIVIMSMLIYLFQMSRQSWSERSVSCAPRVWRTVMTGLGLFLLAVLWGWFVFVFALPGLFPQQESYQAMGFLLQFSLLGFGIVTPIFVVLAFFVRAGVRMMAVYGGVIVFAVFGAQLINITGVTQRFAWGYGVTTVMGVLAGGAIVHFCVRMIRGKPL